MDMLSFSYSLSDQQKVETRYSCLHVCQLPEFICSFFVRIDNVTFYMEGSNPAESHDFLKTENFT